MAIQQINGNQIGTTGGAWASYVPTWTGVTIGNAVVTAKYIQIGKKVTVRVAAVLGTTSSVTGMISLSLPVTAAAYTGTVTIPPLGISVYWNGTSAMTGQVQLESTSLARLYVFNAAGTYSTLTNLGATIPFTWASTNEIQLTFTYEAA